METKEELQQIIKDLKSKLDETTKKLKNFDILDRWEPQKGETYYLVNDSFEVSEKHYDRDFTDASLLKANNAFKYKDQALKFARRIKIEIQLELIANRLNNGREIDWVDNEQSKYHLYLDPNGRLFQDFDVLCKRQGIIYCLDNSFLDVVKREINMTELLEYMKG